MGKTYKSTYIKYGKHGKNIKYKKRKTCKKCKKNKKIRKDRLINMFGGASDITSFKQLNCSPNDDKLSFSCFTPNQIIKLKNIWNTQYPDKQIKSTSPKDIWDQLYKYQSCENELCWVNNIVGHHSSSTTTTNIKNNLLSSFAPSTPKEWNEHPNTWLSSTDITKVMDQYEKNYSCFNFLGPSPIDYDYITDNNK